VSYSCATIEKYFPGSKKGINKRTHYILPLLLLLLLLILKLRKATECVRVHCMRSTKRERGKCILYIRTYSCIINNNIYKCTCRQFTRMYPLLTPYQHYMYNITYYNTGTLCSAWAFREVFTRVRHYNA